MRRPGTPGPVLLVHGTRDEAVPPSDAELYFAAFPTRDKTLHQVAGADHTYNRGEWTDQVIETTVAWLRRHLLPAPQS
ncbi:MAG: alpha/beta hydrolase [Limnochordaceae bacterium]|nr:alpha/beta hydrolase [Limnochordaceae bacterium]